LRESSIGTQQIIESPLSLPYAVAIADLFMRRFDPANPLSTAAFAAEVGPLAEAMQRSSSDQRQLELLMGMLAAVEAVKRTNLYLPKRYGLAMRLDASHLGHGTVGSDMPYGALCAQPPALYYTRCSEIGRFPTSAFSHLSLSPTYFPPASRSRRLGPRRLSVSDRQSSRRRVCRT